MNFKKRKRTLNDEEEEQDGLFVKKDSDGVVMEEEDLPEVNVHQVSDSRNKKRIRIDSSHHSQHITFDDEGKEESNDLFVQLKQQSQSKDSHPINVEQENDEYMERIKDCLSSNALRDKEEAKERI